MGPLKSRFVPEGRSLKSVPNEGAMRAYLGITFDSVS